MYQFNYMVDLPWLMSYVGSAAKTLKTTVIHGLTRGGESAAALLV